jgi:hypothetical protein
MILALLGNSFDKFIGTGNELFILLKLNEVMSLSLS